MKNTVSLNQNTLFRRLYYRGKTQHSSIIVLHYMPNRLKVNRLGITVSKKVGNSVVRHHLCRLLRESYRLHEDMFDSGLDIAVVVRKGTDSCSFHEIERSLIHLAKIHHIYKETNDEKNNDSDDQTV